MPGYKQHLLIGTIVAAISFWIIHKFQIVDTTLTGIDWIVLAIVVFIYSQLPDLDSDASKINKIWNTTAGIGGLFLILTNTNVWLGTFCILSIVGLEWVAHRGFTHDVWFAVLLSAPLLFWGQLIAIVGFISYLSHIIADGEFGK
ncbi:MAG: hypothetical protein DRN81_04255 [Thermoproteota archaeon]|nr:MAG: hypothetical protein DRN81_04255 [Candidatus Korarchaeota archaeon]